MAIVDTILPGIRNFSKAAEGYVFTLSKLETLKKANPQIDTVFLGAGYHNFVSSTTAFYLKPNVADKYFFIVPLSVKWWMIRNAPDPMELLQSSMVYGAKAAKAKTRNTSFLGNYENYLMASKPSRATIDLKIHERYFDGDHVGNTSEIAELYFNKIVQYCQDQNIKLIVLDTPTSNYYKESVPQKFKDFYNKVVNNTIERVDFSALDLPEDEFVEDGDHIIYSGTKKTTAFFAELFHLKIASAKSVK